MMYLLCHGFGFCNDYWKNLIPFLDHEYAFYDKDFTPSTENDYIGIGHSLGFLKLNNSRINFKALIGLQGFLNFCGEEIERKERLQKTLDRMTAKCLLDHKRFLKFFYSLCGYSNSTDLSKIKPEQLLQDLELMRHSYTHCNAATLIIGSKYDRVVEHAILLDNFENKMNIRLEYINNVNHTLGFHEAKNVFDLIKNFIEEIS